MIQQVYYEDIEVGSDIPALVKHPTLVQLVKYAGAVDDYSPYNFDREYARSIGLPDVLVTGSLLFGFLAQMVTDWIGEQGTIKKLSCSHRAMRHPSTDIVCRGKVTSKYVEEGKGYVECEIWAENTEGQRSTPGAALVILPLKR
jgi:acyl dehydratase